MSRQSLSLSEFGGLNVTLIPTCIRIRSKVADVTSLFGDKVESLSLFLLLSILFIEFLLLLLSSLHVLTNFMIFSV
ncbi:unnamed protein product [Heterobilharzia americana]|nr:unnamed protein product [Heterobilharzia americana]